MMKSLIFIFVLFFTTNVYSYNFFTNFPTKNQTISGVTYPQNYRYLYSGTTKKSLDLNNAVAAMLDTKPVFYASKAFADITKCLMKKKGCKKDIINYWDLNLGYLSQLRRNYIVSLINSKKQNNDGAFASWDEAALISKVILDEYFTWLGNDNLYKNFVKFRSTITGTNVETTNTNGIAWPSETVYTSTLSRISALYGPRTVIMKEETPRSLDLGYWNLLNSGYWYGTARDSGEFLAAGYILGRDIKGYQIRKVTGGSFKPSKTKFGKRWQAEWHAIDYAFYQEETSVGKVVVILRGLENACIRRVSAFKYEYCIDTIQTVIKPKKLKAAKDDEEKLNRLARDIRKNPVRYPRGAYGVPPILGLYKIDGAQTPSEYKIYSNHSGPSKGEKKWLSKKVQNAEFVY